MEATDRLFVTTHKMHWLWHLEILFVVVVERREREIHEDVHDKKQKHDEAHRAPLAVVVGWQPVKATFTSYQNEMSEKCSTCVCELRRFVCRFAQPNHILAIQSLIYSAV